MNKVAIISDIHFGVRQDSQIFHQYYNKFFANVFFPKLEQLGIDTVLDLGDIWDRRKYINFNTLAFAKEKYFDQIANKKINYINILGNHDTYYRSTNDLNSSKLLLSKDTNICVVQNVCELDVKGQSVLFVPWINNENIKSTLAAIESSTAPILLGHLEINGFEMHRGIVCSHGLDPQLFDKFQLVLSGHFHSRSKNSHIQYVGSPFEHTWNDFGSIKGFHILDLDTLQMEFIPNVYQMFHKIVYSEGLLENIDFEQYRDTYVKVVKNNTNAYAFEKFIEQLTAYNPADIKIVEERVITNAKNVDVNEIEDTLTLLEKYIDADINSLNDKDSVKIFVKDLYQQALHLEI